MGYGDHATRFECGDGFDTCLINRVNGELLACTIDLMRCGWRRNAFTARHLYPFRWPPP